MHDPSLPLPFGPWWELYRRLVALGSSPPLVPTALALSHILQGGCSSSRAEAHLAQLEERTLDHVGDHARDSIAAAQAVVEGLASAGFIGDAEHYEDPANSYLDRVLERRRGLPITLSVLALHLARHAGVPLQGVGLPGHFVVGIKLDEPQPLVLDPFHGGRVLEARALERHIERVTGRRHSQGDWRRFVRPVSERQIVARMLRNLVRYLHLARGAAHADAAERLLSITTEPGSLHGGPVPA